jgi:chromosome segregation ATPase
LLSEIKRRVQVATTTISTLESQKKELTKTKTTTTTTTTTTTVTEQITKITILIKQQEEIIKTETVEQTKTEKLLATLETDYKKTLKDTNKLKRDLKRGQESYEDSQRKLRKEVDVRSKIEEYRKKAESGKKTLQQKYTQITKIMLQIKQEIETHRKRIVSLTEQVEDCTKRTSMARTTITTLSSKQQMLEGQLKKVKGGDAAKVKAASDKLETELENAKNSMSVAESQCGTLKEEVSKITGVVVQYQQEWKYYTSIITTVKKEIEEAEKNVVKASDTDKEEEAEEKEEKADKKEEKKVTKEKVTTSSTTNEVKQIETQEETTTTTVTELEKELEETDATITKTTEEITKISETITKDEGEAQEEKKDLEKITRRKQRQKCAVLFPAVFTQFSKRKSLRTAGMCPCQGNASGVSQISLAVDAPEEADKVVQ